MSMGCGKFYEVDKKTLSSLYGVFRSARGGGRIHAAAQRSGYDQLILQAIRLKLRYPPKSCPDIDRYIDRLMLERDYGDRYYFTNVFDQEAVTIRRSK